MNELDVVLRRFGLSVLLAPVLIGLPIALFAGGVDLPEFIAVAILWLLVSMLLILGPDSISKVTFWQASIERDVHAAKEARIEAERIRDDLRDMARLQIENDFVLASLVAASCNQEFGKHPAIVKVEQNLEKLTPLVSKDPALVSAWQSEMRQLLRAEPRN